MTATDASPPRRAFAWDGNWTVVAAGAGAVAALTLLPLVTSRPNRIVSGRGLRLWEVPSTAAWAAGAAVLALLLLAGSTSRQTVRVASGFAAILLLLATAGFAGTALLPAEGFARVSLGSGFWIGLAALALLVVDGLVRLDLRPSARVAVLAGALALLAPMMASGVLADLSLAREYAAYARQFWTAAGEHVFLVLLSLVPALLIGLPLGRWCYRSQRLEGPALAVLNVFQTTPSVALFAFLMVPLTALAARFPALRELGIQGVGRTPAVVALFLYALLPITASTLAAFRSVDRTVIEVGRCVGMTGRQLLAEVEIPLALPVILAGIRVALVQNIGLATIAALVGGGGFGTIVFLGMGQASLDLSLLGALPIVALSLIALILFDAAIDGLRGRGA
jgi:osmoprotectant transport system permease protein